MAAKKQEKEKLTDFDKSSKGEKPAPVGGKQVADIATLKNEQARKVFGFLLLVFTAVLLISFVSFYFLFSKIAKFSFEATSALLFFKR